LGRWTWNRLPCPIPSDRSSRASRLALAASPAKVTDRTSPATARWLRVTRTDLRCVEILARDGTATPATLGPALGLTSGGVTAMLVRLEREGFLRRAPDSTDRRRVTVRVTDRTLRFAELFCGPIAREGADMISHYSAAELRLLADFFRVGRELQERHLARVQDLPRPVENQG
jgi:DNA-binding MarR family transcriptional regulator